MAFWYDIIKGEMEFYMPNRYRKIKTINNYEGTPDVDTSYQSMPRKTELIGWGEPALRTQVKFDKVCPKCGLTRKNGFHLDIEDDGWVNCSCLCGFKL